MWREQYLRDLDRHFQGQSGFFTVTPSPCLRCRVLHEHKHEISQATVRRVLGCWLWYAPAEAECVSTTAEEKDSSQDACFYRTWLVVGPAYSSAGDKPQSPVATAQMALYPMVESCELTDESPYVEPYDMLWCTPPKPRCVCIEAPMGSGKTTALERLLAQPEWSQRSVLIVCPRQTLVHQYAQRLSGLGFTTHYKCSEVYGIEARKLIITPESLWRLQRASTAAVMASWLGPPFDLVVLDELSCTVDSFMQTETHGNYYSWNLSVLDALLEQASRTLVTCADLTATVRNAMFLSRWFTRTEQRWLQYQTDTVRRHMRWESPELWWTGLHQRATHTKEHGLEAQRVFVACSIVRQAEAVTERWQDVCGFAFRLPEAHYSTGETAMGRTQQERDFRNVTQEWTKYSLVAATTRAAFGISFDDKKAFVEVRGLLSNRGANVRHLMQLLCRVRHPASSVMPVTTEAKRKVKHTTPQSAESIGQKRKRGASTAASHASNSTQGGRSTESGSQSVRVANKSLERCVKPLQWLSTLRGAGGEQWGPWLAALYRHTAAERSETTRSLWQAVVRAARRHRVQVWWDPAIVEHTLKQQQQL